MKKHMKTLLALTMALGCGCAMMGDKTAMTRGEMAESLYATRPLREFKVSYGELCSLLESVSQTLDATNRHDAFADIAYDHPLNNAVYYALANGYVQVKENGRFDADEPISAAEARRLKRRRHGKCSIRRSEAPQLLKSICERSQSALAEAMTTHCIKQAALALSSEDIAPKEFIALKGVLAELKAANLPHGDIETIVGSPNDPNRWIFREGKGPFTRHYTFGSLKPDTEPVELVIFNDTHFNLVNEKDEAEANPSVLSTREYRRWLRNGASAELVKNAMHTARYADQTIVAGDVLDYLSWGCMQLTVECLFRKDTDILACLGGHDTTRVMQGKVADPSPIESRRDFLRAFWPHDIHYTSRVLRDKVMVIVLDNGQGGYEERLLAPLAADLEKARRENLVVIIVQHEPVCTRNPEETDVAPLRRNDPGNYNYAERLSGNPKDKWGRTQDVYNLIVRNADIVRAVVCGHMHSDYYVEIIGTEQDAEGNATPRKIPQIVNTGVVYDGGAGHIVSITIK